MTNYGGLDKILIDLAVRIDTLEQSAVNAPRLGEETTRSIYDTLHKLLNALDAIEHRLAQIERLERKKCDCRCIQTVPYKRTKFLSTNPENEDGSD